jgi:hypothetical protein
MLAGSAAPPAPGCLFYSDHGSNLAVSFIQIMLEKNGKICGTGKKEIAGGARSLLKGIAFVTSFF